MEAAVYDETFFDLQVQGALASAPILVPTVLRYVHPERMVDVGCGEGAWLRVFKEAGIREVLGIDGAYVHQERLLIDRSEFRPIDLSRSFEGIGRFDLAVCLEVAEHLPPSSASCLVQSLTALAPLVLFSAALPMQGGTHHVNEQKPGYWQALFAAEGFERLDLIRPQIWQDRRIEFWYRQNMVFYASREALTRWDVLRTAANTVRDSDMELVHRKILEKYVSGSVWLPIILKNLGRAISRHVKRRWSLIRTMLCKGVLETDA